MTIFGHTRAGPFLNDRANFHNIGTSLLTLFRIATGDGWEGLLFDMSAEPDGCDIVGDCGNAVLATLFIISFNIVVSLIMMNVLVSIFLENFDMLNEQSKFKITIEHIEEYEAQWTRLEPTGSGVLSIKQLPRLLRRLPPPLGLGIHANGAQMIRCINSLRVPDTETRSVSVNWLVSGTRALRAIATDQIAVVRYYDLLFALCYRACGIGIPNCIEGREVHKRVVEKLGTISMVVNDRETSDRGRRLSEDDIVPVVEVFAAQVIMRRIAHKKLREYISHRAETASVAREELDLRSRFRAKTNAVMSLRSISMANMTKH